MSMSVNAKRPFCVRLQVPEKTGIYAWFVSLGVFLGAFHWTGPMPRLPRLKVKPLHLFLIAASVVNNPAFANCALPPVPSTGVCAQLPAIILCVYYKFYVQVTVHRVKFL